MEIIFQLVLISVTWSSLVAPEAGVIKIVPASSAKKLGWSYNLQCTITGNIQNRSIVFERNNVRICQIRWYRAVNVICNATYNVESGYECQCIGLKNYTLVYRVMIKSFSTEDATRWSCSSIDSDGAAGPVYVSNYVYLYCVTLSGNKEMFDVDGLNSITFTCTTSNMTGRAEFTWINKTSGEPIENNLTVYKHNDSYSQQLNFIPHWYQDGNGIVCKAFNADTKMTTTSNVKVMNLTYPPLTHPVIKQDNNSNSTLDSEIITREGAMLHLSCEVTGGKPRVSNVSIVCDDITVYTARVQDGAVGRISFKVWRNIHNHTCLCSATHITGRYNLTTTVTILVNYAPDVTVRHDFNSSNETLTVTCEAEGRPESFTFSPFTHFWNKYKIRALPGQLAEFNRNVLTIYNVTYADSGRYRCDVSNGIEPLNKVKVQNGSTSLVIDEKPILDYGGRQNQTVSVVLGESFVLEKKLFSKSNITNHTWTHGGSYQNLTGQLSTTEVMLNIYNITVKDLGYSITLKISKINNYTLGSYTLNVCNSFGCNHFQTTLNIIISADNKDDDYNSVNRTNAQREPVTSDPILIPAVSGAAGFVVLLLIVIVIICVIKKRRNSQTNKTDTCNKDDDYNSVNRTNAQRETGITDGGNTSVIHDDKLHKEPVMEDNELYFESRNARKHKQKPEADIKDDEHVSVNQKDKEAEPVMHDNDIYFMPSSKKRKQKPVMEDEPGPDDQGVDVKPEDVSAMYSVVNKHRNHATDDITEPAGNDINSTSSVVNGEDKQPGDEDFSSLYSSVNKHPKTVADDNTQPTDDDTNALYSVVNKKNKMKANDNTTHPAEEEEEGGINDVYSVVNKKSKTERDGNTEPTA